MIIFMSRETVTLLKSKTAARLLYLWALFCLHLSLAIVKNDGLKVKVLEFVRKR